MGGWANEYIEVSAAQVILYERSFFGSIDNCSTPKNASSIIMTFNSQIKTPPPGRLPWSFLDFFLPFQSHFLPLFAWNLSLFYTLLLFPLNILLQCYWTTARFPWTFLDGLPWAGTPCSLPFSPFHQFFFSFESQSRSLLWSSCPRSELDFFFFVWTPKN